MAVGKWRFSSAISTLRLSIWVALALVVLYNKPMWQALHSLVPLEDW